MLLYGLRGIGCFCSLCSLPSTMIAVFERFFIFCWLNDQIISISVYVTNQISRESYSSCPGILKMMFHSCFHVVWIKRYGHLCVPHSWWRPCCLLAFSMHFRSFLRVAHRGFGLSSPHYHIPVLWPALTPNDLSVNDSWKVSLSIIPQQHAGSNIWRECRKQSHFGMKKVLKVGNLISSYYLNKY